MISSNPPKSNHSNSMESTFQFPHAPFHFGTSLFLSFMRSSALPLKMDHPNFSVFRTFLQIIFLTTLANETLSLDLQFEACSPRSCGNGPNISYPFWIAHEQESFCGYPNFGITCKEDHPVLTISDYDYIVKDIFYSDYLFRVVDSVVSEKICPAPLRNVSLDRTPFYLSPDSVDFLFLYNCSESRPDYLTYPVSCTSNASDYSFAVFHKEAFENLNYSLESCQSFVKAPVDMDAHSNFSSLLSMNYTEILKMGFLMNWTAHSCSDCESSGGRCGFDNNQFICFCKDRPHSKTCNDDDGPSLARKIGTAAATGSGVSLICIFACLLMRKRNSSSIQKMGCLGKLERSDPNIEDFIRNYGNLAPNRYNFSDVKKMTISFKEKLGQGGYGNVYKGRLIDGRLVAVKVLNSSEGNGQEFINEVASISRTSHVNIVTLLGFCLEGRKRALIYEFMPNGSLEKFIFKANEKLGWKRLHQIAVGVARGLHYLHQGCNTRIFHFDIKPHNILLDEDFCPKISDFGLSKLCNRTESIVSMLEARGTIGYIAPEVFSRNFGAVSHKSDVYSYGMLILEMVGGRKNIDAGVNTSEIYFPHWIHKHLEQGNELNWLGLMTREESEMAKKMILVGLWCIQTIPSDRPSIGKAIDMLEGCIEALQIPPMPFLSSPRRSPEDNSRTTSLL